MRENRSPDEQTSVVVQSHATINPGLKLLYEVDDGLGHLVPRLRLILNDDIDMDSAVSGKNCDNDSNSDVGHQALYSRPCVLEEFPCQFVSD